MMSYIPVLCKHRRLEVGIICHETGIIDNISNLSMTVRRYSIIDITITDGIKVINHETFREIKPLNHNKIIQFQL